MSPRQLFWLSLLAGFAPLAAQAVLWLGDAPTWETMRGALMSTVIAAALLVLLVRALPMRLLTLTGRSLAGLSAVAERVSESDFGGRADVGGPGKELRELGVELNALIDEHKNRVLHQRLEAEKAGELRVAARRLIEECLYAREPLAKQHPGLATAYAEAAIRHSGRAGLQDTTVDALVHSVETAMAHKGNREHLRWSLDNVTVEVPVPSKLINMSVTGMAVESNRGLPVGGSWLFRVGNGACAYDIPGKVRWCRLDRTVRVADEVRPIYRTGVAFDSKLTGRAFDFFSPPISPGGRPATAWP